MNIKKTVLVTAIGMALGGITLSAGAALTTSSVLNFNSGAFTAGTTKPAAGSGSWFSLLDSDLDFDSMADTASYVPISQNNGIHIGTIQAASGSHGGLPGCDPSAGNCTGAGGSGESPNIDNPWGYFGNTGMHNTTSPVTVKIDSGVTKILDFTGWNATWNNLSSIPLGGDTTNFAEDDGDATLVCSSATCSSSSTFVLDYGGHLQQGDPSNYGGVLYSLHLEGVVSAAVPVPAAAWLFGSGLLGLVGVARRKKTT